MKDVIFSVLFFFAFSLTVYCQPGRQYSRENIPDTTIQSILNEINADSINYNIQKLQDFGTRFLFNSNRTKIVDWLKSRFLTAGLVDITVDTFTCKTSYASYTVTDTFTTQYNVVATIKGEKYPDHVIIIGAHYDSYSGFVIDNPAPGANDDASGTSAVLEIARVITKKNYQPDYTLKFIAFGAEELMLRGNSGSGHYAENAKKNGMDIGLMLSLDMISNSTVAIDKSSLKIIYPEGYAYLYENASRITKKFTKIQSFISDNITPGHADAGSFWAQGFPSLYLEESTRNVYYHTPNDLLKNCNIGYCTEITKSAAAILLSAYPRRKALTELTIKDAGNGNTLLLNWKNTNPQEYPVTKILVGTSFGVYPDTITTTSENYSLSNLTTGKQYFILVYALNKDKVESQGADGVGTPGLLPLAPVNVADNPERELIKLTWTKNPENDLKGYYIYRSENNSSQWTKTYTVSLNDTSYSDKNLSKDSWYYFKVVAFDSAGNESINNTVIKSHLVSLHKGILVISETRNGDGSFMNPLKADVLAFYASMLKDSTVSNFELATAGKIKLADIGEYSILILHNENNWGTLSTQNNNVEEVRKYIKSGGKILYTGFRPTTDFQNILDTAKDFATGSFMYDMLKIKHINFSTYTQFCGANPADISYNYLRVDSTKNKANPHITYVECLTPNDEGKVIYTFDTRYPSDQLPGKFKGMPVGIEYLGNDFKAITLSFPLYYINQSDAGELLKRCILKLKGPVQVENNMPPWQPSAFKLYQNFPNPFNPVTVISFDITEKCLVELYITDILGRKVANLLNEEKQLGKHNISFDAGKLSSGIYFYTIHAGANSVSRKMLLLK